MKNYLVHFIAGDPLKVTAEDASEIAQAWARGDKAIVYNGEVFASHQLARITPNKAYERDYCGGETLPRIEDFVSNKKLLK